MFFITRLLAVIIALYSAVSALAQDTRVPLRKEMLVNEVDWCQAEGIIDEQDKIGDPPKAGPVTPWPTDWRHAKEFPVSAYFDLGEEKPLSALCVYDINSSGMLELAAGEPGKWRKITEYNTDSYMKWVRVPLDVKTRYLRLTRNSPGCQLSEIAIYAYTPDAWNALQERKKNEARLAEEKRLALTRAQEEVKNRPLIDLGPLFGKLPLVDEIDCAVEKPDHLFTEFPAGASQVERLLGEPYRTLKTRPGEASYISWRVGKYKLLKPGAAYLLTLEYPEDEPRSMVVLNGGCETSRGFYTGACVGDALRAKYVWSNPESLRIPLSGRREIWKQFFYLHDRFPERAFIRGTGPRTLTPDDGFPVTVAQFSQENDPPSHGVAVRRLRLFEVTSPTNLSLQVNFPPAGLPRRHIFWREEMADGVIDSAKLIERGIDKPLDWYRYKARLMHLLAINTYTKDLLEFGACQHWDSSPGGGNDWVFFSDRHKDLWGNVVKLMGGEGFSVLPYYEYAGSRGYKSLGHQRRAKPLTRDDAYTHISWIEQANADLTDPDTVADFKKMLDHTVIRFQDQAPFLGAWLRPRSQLPIGFGDATRARFATQANNGQAITRQQLIADKALCQQYYDWWFGKRRAFLEAMRDHLRAAGVNPDPMMLYTADASEPGVSFRSWEPKLVTDDPGGCAEWLNLANTGKERPITAITLAQVAQQELYLKALTTPPLDWGGWEPTHANPAADPQNYIGMPGALMTHGFNRSYTVTSKTLDSFRGPSGLAIVRHHSLNENMFFDKAGKDLLGYVVADMERAGPYCLHAEALAVANGDPRFIGYLVGSCFNRGFPEYVREFNAAFLSLPALPSRRLENVSSDSEVVVRMINTDKHGVWLAVINTGLGPKKAVHIKIPITSAQDCISGASVPVQDGSVLLDMEACQLRTFKVVAHVDTQKLPS